MSTTRSGVWAIKKFVEQARFSEVTTDTRGVEVAGSQNLVAADMEGLRERGPVIFGTHHAVNGKRDAGIIEADLAADNARFGESQCFDAVRVGGVQNRAFDFRNPVPVLADQQMPVFGRFGKHRKRRAAVYVFRSAAILVVQNPYRTCRAAIFSNGNPEPSATPRIPSK